MNQSCLPGLPCIPVFPLVSHLPIFLRMLSNSDSMSPNAFSWTAGPRPDISADD